MYNITMEKKDNTPHIDPTLNGGQNKGDVLACGCDPANVALDADGKRRVFLIKQNANFFAPLGAPGIGMQISLCAQCKEIMGFQVISPAAHPAHPSIVLS
jgi:hypothetical protein